MMVRTSEAEGSRGPAAARGELVIVSVDYIHGISTRSLSEDDRTRVGDAGMMHDVPTSHAAGHQGLQLGLRSCGLSRDCQRMLEASTVPTYTHIALVTHAVLPPGKVIPCMCPCDLCSRMLHLDP